MTFNTEARASSVRQRNKRKRDEFERKDEAPDISQTKRTKLDQSKTQTRHSTKKRSHDEVEGDEEDTAPPMVKKAKLSKRELKQVRQENARRLHNKQVWKQPDGVIDLNMRLVQDSAVNAIVIHNMSSSPLLKLPGEIRNKIYKELLTERVIKINRGRMEKKKQAWMQKWNTRVYSGKQIDPTTKFAPDPEFAMLATCRQIYHETATLFHKKNTFAFDTEKDMTDWAASILPAQRDVVQTIQAGPQLTSTIMARSITFSTPKLAGMTAAHLANIKLGPGAPQRVFSGHLPTVNHVIAEDPGCGSSAFTTAIQARDSYIQKVSVIPR